MTGASPAQAYLDRLEMLLADLGPDLPGHPELRCKRFFGGAAAYADGRIFLTLTPVGLALKLPAAGRETLLAEGGAPLRYFAKGHVKKDYVVVPEAVAGRPAALAPWIAESLRFVTTP